MLHTISTDWLIIFDFKLKHNVLEMKICGKYSSEVR